MGDTGKTDTIKKILYRQWSWVKEAPDSPTVILRRPYQKDVRYARPALLLAISSIKSTRAHYVTEEAYSEMLEMFEHGLAVMNENE